MSSTPRNIAGVRFNRLIPIEPTGHRDKFNKIVWKCLCDCGRISFVSTCAITTGNTKSCGCQKFDSTSKRFRKHGMSGTSIYRIFHLMIARCHNPESQNYRLYGARGIFVCDAWRTSFDAFRKDVGERPSDRHSLDRIDVNLGYEPGNVRWSDQKSQCRNKRNNRIVELNGVRLPVSEWSEILGIDQRLIIKRLSRGAKPEDALATGRRRGNNRPFNGVELAQKRYYAMLYRCSNPQNSDYQSYGGRGITVCERWKGDGGMKAFLSDMGPLPESHSLDRIDVNGNYCPENCRWVPSSEQARNKRNNRLLTLGDQTHCIADWSRMLKIPAYTISMRLRRGWTEERTLQTPSKSKL